MTDPIAAFVTERLNEDERVAQAAGGDRWDNGLPVAVWPDTDIFRTVVASSRAGMRDHVCGSILAADAEHIARQNPARILADVAAKRAIVDSYLKHVRWHDETGGAVREFEAMESVKIAVVALAGAWSDHPDFDRTWLEQ